MGHPDPPQHSVGRALIACGGLGTRLLPATKALPKALLPVLDRPLLQYAVEEVVAAGIHEIGVLFRADQAAIASALTTPPALVDQLKRLERRAELANLLRFDASARFKLFPTSDEAWGLGGQLLALEPFLADAPFALLMVDELCDPACNALTGLLAVHGSCGLTSVCTHGETAGTVPYLIGSIPALDAGSGVAGPRPAQARMIGRYLCTPDVCVALREVANRQGLPVDLIAALRLLAERQALAAHPYPGRWWDCGCRSGFVAATLEMAGEDPGLGPALWSRLRLAP